MAAPARLAALKQLQCAIFQTSYNPKSLRTGAKYLRAHLRGPAMNSYYPETLELSRIAREHPELEIVDPDEEQRFQDIEDKRKRGKGKPKKIRESGAGGRQTRKK